VNNRHDDSDDEDEFRSTRSRHHGRDREITLGTTMILLIFFALAAYGALLFGFGYSLGSKHNGAPGAAVIAGGSSTGAGGFKPSPGSPIGSGGTNKIPLADNKPVSFTTPTPAATQTKTVPLNTSPTADATPESDPKPRTTPSVPTVVPVPISSAADSSANGPALVVQVTALTRQADAEMIATALQHRGYTVNVHTEPDKLYHVQIGPFYSRKDADAMKARLLADGFNAYIK
jgi:DedD protein